MMAKVQGVDGSSEVRVIRFMVIGCMLGLIEAQVGGISDLWSIEVGVVCIVCCMGLVM